MALLNKDIEIGSSLRKLGNKKVTEWEFKEVVPALQKLARKEVDVVGWVKRTANIKVMEWDFRGSLAGGGEGRAKLPPTPGVRVRPEEARVVAEDEMAEKLEVLATANVGVVEAMTPEKALVIRLRKFLLFVAVNLVEETDRAEVRVEQIERGVVRFQLVVAQKDLKSTLGRHGETAAAIRSVLKGSAEAIGTYVLLEIISVEEDLARAAKKRQRSERGKLQARFTSGSNGT
jgi:predicted RNA-binding protein YlqC (UPF0109 family)